MPLSCYANWKYKKKNFIGEVVCQPEKGAFAFTTKKDAYNIIWYYIVMPVDDNRWLSLWVFHLLIYSTNSLENTDSFQNETNNCIYARVVE